MKKILTTLLVMMVSTVLFAQDAKKEKTKEEYIADLNPAKEESLIVAAADYSGKEKLKDALPSLVKLLEDSRENVRLHATMAIGYIGEENGAEPLNKVLLNDESSMVRYAAMLSTLRIGSSKSVDAWKQAKDKESDPYIQDILKKMEDKIKGK